MCRPIRGYLRARFGDTCAPIRGYLRGRFRLKCPRFGDTFWLIRGYLRLSRCPRFRDTKNNPPLRWLVSGAGFNEGQKAKFLQLSYRRFNVANAGPTPLTKNVQPRPRNPLGVRVPHIDEKHAQFREFKPARPVLSKQIPFCESAIRSHVKPLSSSAVSIERRSRKPSRPPLRPPRA